MWVLLWACMNRLGQLALSSLAAPNALRSSMVLPQVLDAPQALSLVLLLAFSLWYPSLMPSSAFACK